MEDFPLLSCWPAGGSTFGNTAIHIPLNIGNICGAEDLVDGIMDIIHHLWTGEVQHILVTAMRLLTAWHMDNPIWMFLVDWGIFIYHFQLHPQAEFHAHVVNALGKTGNAIWQQFLIWCPISQAMIIIPASGEPAIIQNKQLYTGFLSLAGNPYQLVLIKVKVGGFPVVDQDRTNLVPQYSMSQTAAVQLVENMAHAIQACI